jgi:hypothetical protein
LGVSSMAKPSSPIAKTNNMAKIFLFMIGS